MFHWSCIEFAFSPFFIWHGTHELIHGLCLNYLVTKNFESMPKIFANIPCLSTVNVNSISDFAHVLINDYI